VSLAQSETPLADAVDAFLADRRITPFTTPGHKRSPELADPLLAHDLPLSAGADDLHLSGDVLGRAERLAAELWGADLCRFCVNGSTQGNQALALAVGRPGDRVVVSRNLHKSLFAGLVLAGLEPVWVRPEVDPDTGLALAVPLDAVASALAGAEGAAAVLLVEPNFVGVLSDLAGIAALCRKAGTALAVDQAWGAYLGFHPLLPPHALALGADAMVTSAHKTLTGFTQSAYLFARSGRLDLGRIRESFDALNTTSVSAAILASLDRTRALLAKRGEELLGRTIALVGSARQALGGIEGLRTLGPGVGQAYDPTKLVVALAGTGADGLAVEGDLWAEGVRVELANGDTLIPLITIADTQSTVARLVETLTRSIERRRGRPRPAAGVSAIWSVEPEVAMSPRDAFFAPREAVPSARAAGRVSAETIAPYPPGIPAIAPGEVISAPLLESLREAAAAGTRISACADPTLATVQVVAGRAGKPAGT
jgi:lysine decarboxylase